MINRPSKTFAPKLKESDIPDTWSSIEEFYTWYIDAGMPLMPPSGCEVFLSDDATSVALFRKGQFQVEMYLVHPKPLVQLHEHPDVEVVKVYIDGTKFGSEYGQVSQVLRSGGTHGIGGVMQNSKGFMLLAIQHWHPKLVPTTVAAAWRGKTAGPMHEALIRRLRPDALVIPGYADTTKTMDYLEELKNAKSA